MAGRNKSKNKVRIKYFHDQSDHLPLVQGTIIIPTDTVNPVGDTVFSDDFEAGNLNNWTASGETGWRADRFDENSNPPDHSYLNRVAEADNCDTECTITKTTALDMTDYDDEYLQFYRFIDSSLDNTEYLKLEVYNGTGWTDLDIWQPEYFDDDDTWYLESYSLSEYTDVTDFSIRFSAKMSSSSEEVAVDDVRIIATRPGSDGNGGGGGSPAPAPTDTIPPVITAPADKTFEATGAQTVLDSSQIGTATATDNNGSPTITGNAPDSYPLGQTVITWTATDSAGNSASATQTVTVRDTTPPAVTSPGNHIAEATGILTALGAADYGTASAYDLVDASPHIANDAPASFLLGATTVTWTATDSSGNAASTTHIVTVRDTTPPTMTVPEDMSFELVRRMTILTPDDYGIAIAFDLVDVTPYITSNATGLFPPGNTTILWTATDSAGNSATDTQIITIMRDSSSEDNDGTHSHLPFRP